MDQEPVIEYGSGNVFADLDFPEPEEHLAKAKLVHAISRTIKARGLTQEQAAALMGIDQPRVSKILRGRFRDVTADRLMHYLNQLGQDVIITIIPAPHPTESVGRLSVAVAGD